MPTRRDTYPLATCRKLLFPAFVVSFRHDVQNEDCILIIDRTIHCQVQLRLIAVLTVTQYKQMYGSIARSHVNRVMTRIKRSIPDPGPLR